MQNASERQETITKLLTTPDFFPVNLDPKRNTVTFAQMSQELFYPPTFLDNRIARPGAAKFTASLDELMEWARTRSRVPTHFILHGAFCGSTLLARYLERLPHAFVLKEPACFVQLARLDDPARQDALPSQCRPRSEWLHVVMSLLARAYSATSTVVVKASDVCSWMGNALLDFDQATKIVFLSSPLKTFLSSCLKSQERRSWSRRRVREMRRHLDQVSFLRDVGTTPLSDDQCAAAVWLLNSFLCRSCLERADAGERVLVLLSEDVITAPAASVELVTKFMMTRSVSWNSGTETLMYHAKNDRLLYDAATRAKDMASIEQRFGDELEAGVSWADRISGGWMTESPFPVE